MKPSHALAALLALPLALGEGEVQISTPAGPFATFHHGEGDRVPFLWPVLGPGGVEVPGAGSAHVAESDVADLSEFVAHLLVIRLGIGYQTATRKRLFANSDLFQS